MVRIRIAAENAVAVILQLPEAGLKVFERTQLRMIDLDLVGKKIEQKPDEKIGDQDKADHVVGDDGSFERHQIDQADVADLQAGDDHENEAERIGPVPDSDRQGMDIEFLHG